MTGLLNAPGSLVELNSRERNGAFGLDAREGEGARISEQTKERSGVAAV